jgi:4-amino-4-deoxy-L-arabinose transferase-like glycosyltransferase
VAVWSRERTAWLLVFGFGALLRLGLFGGFGLGDDPGYFINYHDIYTTGTWSAARPYDFRFAFWVPVVLCMKLLGDNELAFIAFITFCSLVNLVLIYALARQEWDRPGAILAMALLAVFPLDVLCSTLFVIDIPLATYCFAAFWLYRRSLAPGPPSARLAAAAGSAVVLFLAYSTKQWAVLVGFLFLAEALRDWRATWRYSLVAGGGFLTLVAAYFGWQWARFGDPIYDIHLVRKVAAFLPLSREIVLDYPRMLLLPNEYGLWFGGFYPHVLLVLAVLFLPRIRAAGRWLAYFLVLLAALAAMPSHRDNGRWVVLMPHIFRYLCLLSIPLCLALAAYVRETWRWRTWAGVTLTCGLVVVSVVQSVALTAPTRDAFGEQRQAVAVLRQFPDERVWADRDLYYRYLCLELRMKHADLARFLRSETPEARKAEVAQIDEGIIVTGGGRLPWYGCYRCTANLGSLEIPAGWSELARFEGTITGYRQEPLRIWRVSKADLLARALFDAVSDWDARLRVMHDLMQRNANVVAVAFGRRVLDTPPPTSVDEWLSLTALACQGAHKPSCVTQLLQNGPSAGPEARRRVLLLADAAVAQGDFVQARRWAAVFRERFPDSPPEAALVEIESGLAEGIALYHQSDLRPAHRLFTDIVEREGSDPELSRRAQYFLALTLFRMDRVGEAMRQMEAYRNAHGEDALWTELRFRQGEALALTDPRAAREVLAEIASRHPDTPWAPLAKQKIEMLEGRASPGP